MNAIIVTAAAAMLALSATAATSATFFTDATPTGALASPGTKSYSFTGPARAGSLSFELAGYRTLDGVNCCTDTVDVLLNGTSLLSASYNLGGGGANVVYSGSPKVTFYTSGSPTVYNGTATGGLIDITLYGTFAATNTLTFTYSGSGQGLGDEGWGVNRVSAAIPEPASWLLMIGGLGLVGTAARRRRAVATTI